MRDETIGAMTQAVSASSGTVGKTVGQRLYVHVSALDTVELRFLELLDCATVLAKLAPSDFNIVRFDNSEDALSLLDYPLFFEDAFPSLRRSWKVRVSSGRTTYRTYEQSLNPPVLHRKELLLSASNPGCEVYRRLTSELESLGFFADPVRIGFKVQWERLLDERGFRVVGHQLVPIGNVEEQGEQLPIEEPRAAIARHLTALSRSRLSAPVQLLDRYGFLNEGRTFFDYGCGKGDDLRGLEANGIDVGGWDPHFAPDRAIFGADVVNLGFVINVIEDPVERREALRRAFELARGVLAVSVMLATEEAIRGIPFADGVVTTRRTFQKYYSQGELNEYLADTLGEQAIPIAPGIFLVFKDKDAEQRFQTARYRGRLRVRPGRPSPPAPRLPRVRLTRMPRPDRFEELRPVLDGVWKCYLDLGREPEGDEVPDLTEVEVAVGSLRKAIRLIESRYDLTQLDVARHQRSEDLRVYFALQQFQRRKPYGHLEARVQRDVKTFFGNYTSALDEGKELLTRVAQQSVVEGAAIRAAEQGLGWLDPGASLRLHGSLLSQLPPELRAYVGCASVFYGDLENVDLVKIHLTSGKVSLMTFDDFLGTPLPRMTRRVKVNLRTQTVDVFEYGAEYPPPFQFLKSRFINEETEGYAEQLAFDESLQQLNLFDLVGYGPSPDNFANTLHEAHWTINGFKIERSHYMPDLDAKCGRTFTYRQLIECGDTQSRLKLPNLPKEPSTYTAIYDLATRILDPVVEYFGGIRLTYGFCSPELARHIKRGIAPELDQHAGHERKRSGPFVCARLGAAVDFVIEDESMQEVTNWIAANLPFDRLYFYGEDRPIHVSYGPEIKGEVIEVATDSNGRRIPRMRKVG